jgi:hypothetical protein
MMFSMVLEDSTLNVVVDEMKSCGRVSEIRTRGRWYPNFRRLDFQWLCFHEINEMKSMVLEDSASNVVVFPLMNIHQRQSTSQRGRVDLDLLPPGFANEPGRK